MESFGKPKSCKRRVDLDCFLEGPLGGPKPIQIAPAGSSRGSPLPRQSICSDVLLPDGGNHLETPKRVNLTRLDDPQEGSANYYG